jgi:putative ABC transport system permease protein
MKRFSGSTTLRMMQVSAASAAQMVKVQNGIAELLRQRHRIQDGRDDDFILRNQQEITEAQTATTDVMTALLAGVATISLLVGGIGIMNIMLVSVTERTREIGIRMAVGARGHDILLQFLIEAVTLSSIGGILGILLGVSAHSILKFTVSICELLRLHSDVLTSVANGPTLVSPGIVVIAFVFSAAVGIFFGFYPARKASKLDPIDALRYE